MEGTVKKVKFMNDLTGWGVIELFKDDGSKVIAKGDIGHQYPGYKLSLSGGFVDNPRGRGQVFEVKDYTVVPPTTSEGIFLFLTSGVFKGMSKRIARDLVDLYGDKTLTLLNADIGLLRTVKGVGAKTFMKIRDSYQDARPQQERLFELIKVYKFSFNEALNIIGEFPDNALDVIRKSPYSMFRRLDKVQFVRFDNQVMAAGWDHLDKQRIREVIHYHMRSCSKNGSTRILKELVVRDSVRYLRIDRYLVENEIDFLLSKRGLFLHPSPKGPLLQSKWFYTVEKEIANRLQLINSTPAVKELIFDPDDERLIPLKSHQRRGIVAPFLNKVSIITGRPGSGKTTLLRTMLNMFETQNLTMLALTPTGKAAQRLKEVSGRGASTIHRALGATHISDEFVFNDMNLLDVDVIVVDEMSMLDVNLFRSLLRATPYTTRLVLIGDVEQLPSVGPGAVYRDLIKCGCFDVYWLTEVLRIKSKDGTKPTPLIVSGNVLNGDWKNITPNDSEWEYHPTNGNQETLSRVSDIIKDLISKDIPYTDIQVFSPVNSDELGVDSLNSLVKKCFYENGTDEIEVNDKVMQLDNNYELDVYNGDIGIVEKKYVDYEISTSDDPALLVRMSSGLVEFSKKQIKDLILAYAITGHKSQGSEYPYVIIVIPDDHFNLMDRYWLYTLVTRCQVKVYIVGNHYVTEQTVVSKNSHMRGTLLVEQLQKFIPQNGVEFKD